MSRKNIKKRNRSGYAICSICCKTGPVIEHHISGRKIAKKNSPHNIACICPSCHYSVHLPLTHPENIDIDGWKMSDTGMVLVYRKNGITFPF